MGDAVNAEAPSGGGPVRTPDHIMWKSLPDGVVLLNVNTGEHYQLNETGAIVWGGLVQNLSADAIVERIRQDYETDEATARRDVEAMIAYLVSEGCVLRDTKESAEGASREIVNG